ncbi:hypothetical protein D3C87_1382960 [compost metagenome]
MELTLQLVPFCVKLENTAGRERFNNFSTVDPLPPTKLDSEEIIVFSLSPKIELNKSL